MTAATIDPPKVLSDAEQLRNRLRVAQEQAEEARRDRVAKLNRELEEIRERQEAAAAAGRKAGKEWARTLATEEQLRALCVRDEDCVGWRLREHDDRCCEEIQRIAAKHFPDLPADVLEFREAFLRAVRLLWRSMQSLDQQN